MSNRPTMGMKVSDISVTIKFCVEKLGFTLVDYQPDADMAHVLDTDKDLLLLVGPEAHDVSQHLDPPRFVFKPGATIRFLQEDLEAWRALLETRDVSSIFEDGFLGDRALNVLGPDDYTFAFIKRVPHTPEEVLVWYAQGPSDLEAVLVGLSESDLDLALAPGQWSIRQIVHHLAEGESLFMMQGKTALAQSGSTYIRNTYNQEIWPEVLDYAGRPVESSVALLEAIRAHILQILPQVPDYWERYVMVKGVDVTSEGQKVTVGSWLDQMARHTWEHCAEIREIRRIHNI